MNKAIAEYLTLPTNNGLEYRIAVPPVLSTSMLIDNGNMPNEMPPTFKLVYRLVTRNLDGYLYKFMGAER